MPQSLAYGNGNVLAYAEYGSPTGYPILVQHGLIAGIGDVRLFDSLIKSGIRLICMARPGYGESSPYRLANMAAWGDIVASLGDYLGLAHFDVLGISSGAPYSYAIGYKMPDQVRNIFILSGTPALYDAAVLALWPYPVNQTASIAELQDLAYALYFAPLSQDARQQDDVRDSMRNRCFGIAQDFSLRCNQWGFLLSDVKATVYMQHSQTDDQVPFATAAITAQLLPNCRFDVRASGDHFSQEVLDSFIRTTVLPHYGMG